MFGAPFMQNAAIALVILAVVAAIVGVALNLRDLEFVSDGLVHAVFPGVVIGLAVGGTDALYIGAIIAALIATVLLTIATNRGVSTDASTAVLLAGAFALGIVIVSKTTTYTSGVESLLFGQLLMIDSSDLIVIAVLGALALILTGVTWKEQVFISFDRRGAEATGMRVFAYELALNLAIALVVVAAARAVGNLLVLALLIVPAAVGRLLSRRLSKIVVIGIVTALVGSFVGLVGGYWLSVDARLPVSPSAVLVLTLVAIYLLVAAMSEVISRIRAGRRPVVTSPIETVTTGSVGAVATGEGRA
ncbi:Chelated iron transport system membrane protein yfeD [Gulosibacter molinativorax]|nr:Chelated iron transport system membrane protein yfeD [Gulosibacter molinativorax]